MEGSVAGTTTLDRECVVTCGFAFSMNTPVKRLKIECFVCNTPNHRRLFHSKNICPLLFITSR